MMSPPPDRVTIIYGINSTSARPITSKLEIDSGPVYTLLTLQLMKRSPQPCHMTIINGFISLSLNSLTQNLPGW